MKDSDPWEMKNKPALVLAWRVFLDWYVGKGVISKDQQCHTVGETYLEDWKGKDC